MLSNSMPTIYIVLLLTNENFCLTNKIFIIKGGIGGALNKLPFS